MLQLKQWKSKHFYRHKICLNKSIFTENYRRFPDYASMIKAGFLLPHEAEHLASIGENTSHEITWTPILWAVNLIHAERTAGRIIVEAPIYATLISSFDYIDSCNRTILNHGWVNFPLGKIINLQDKFI